MTLLRCVSRYELVMHKEASSFGSLASSCSVAMVQVGRSIAGIAVVSEFLDGSGARHRRTRRSQTHHPTQLPNTLLSTGPHK